MERILKKGGTLFLSIPFRDKEKLNFLVTRRVWDVGKKCYTLPLSTAEDLHKMFPGAETNKAFVDYLKERRKDFRALSLVKSGNLTLEESSFKEIKNNQLLKGYQETGITFLYKTGRALLADEMGLGKAVMSLATVLQFKREKNIRKVLIVCPNSIKFSVWQKEVEKWTTENCLVIDGSKEEKLEQLDSLDEHLFVIINYEAVRIFYKQLQAWKPDLVILDECQAIKNRRAKQTQAVKMIDASYRILLTGTPILNRSEELWSLLNYIDPIYWSSYSKFLDRFCIVEDKYYGRRRPIRVVTGNQNVGELQEKIFPYYLRRTKAEVLNDLPERIYETRLLSLLPEQRTTYNDFVEELRAEIAGKEIKINRQVAATKILRLLEVCDGLSVLGGEDISAKLDESVNIFLELQKEHKMVFFTWFVQTARSLAERLRKLKFDVVEIDGKTTTKERTELIERFQEDKNCRAFIATISTCGLGLNLTAADVCVFVSRSYVPAMNDQSEARLHRHGQRNSVNIITLVCEGTVEEKVSKLLEKKKNIFEEIFQDEKRIEQNFDSLLKRV